MDRAYVIGLDYGSDSVRAILMNALTGEQVKEDVHYYTRWKKGMYCDPQKNQFRQHPLDYIEGLKVVISGVLKDNYAVASGITIHRHDCPNAKRMREQYSYRIIEAKWRSSAQGSFRVTISVTASDSSGLANRITEVISHDMKLNIRTINFASRGDGSAIGTISVEVPSTGVVDVLIHALQRIKGIEKVTRI